MILTITLNPCLDTTIITNDFKLNSTNKYYTKVENLGGKGINVSSALKNIGIDSKCITLNFSDDDFISKELYNRDLEYKLITVEGKLRNNIKIFDNNTKQMTEINQLTIIDDKSIIDGIISQIQEEIKKLSKDDILVLSGSVPNGFTSDIYAKLIKYAKKQNVFVCLDTSGNLLKEGIKEKPNMIKPNKDELQQILNKDLNSIDEILSELEKLNNFGIDYVCLSMGEDGAIMYSNNGVYIANSLNVDVKALQGAGDSFIAGFCKELKTNNDYLILKSAIACATGTVVQEGTILCSKEDYLKYFDRVEIINIG